MDKKDLNKICVYCLKLNKGEAMNMDDIDSIYKALKEFNGED